MALHEPKKRVFVCSLYFLDRFLILGGLYEGRIARLTSYKLVTVEALHSILQSAWI